MFLSKIYLLLKMSSQDLDVAKEQGFIGTQYTVNVLDFLRHLGEYKCKIKCF